MHNLLIFPYAFWRLLIIIYLVIGIIYPSKVTISPPFPDYPAPNGCAWHGITPIVYLFTVRGGVPLVAVITLGSQKDILMVWGALPRGILGKGNSRAKASAVHTPLTWNTSDFTMFVHNESTARFAEPSRRNGMIPNNFALVPRDAATFNASELLLTSTVWYISAGASLPWLWFFGFRYRMTDILAIMMGKGIDIQLSESYGRKPKDTHDLFNASMPSAPHQPKAGKFSPYG
ncbi:hypothetical protein L218DRAFT_951184 [Marasmius fiardii PR-910]|nr:hypothetical protein L218DRAFT_951184 [Marasmius fiardii PR-910]